MLQVLFIINFRIYNQKCSLCLLYNKARNYILPYPYLYQGQKYIATFCNSYGNSVIYSSGRPITLHKWRKLELNIIILYPQRHKKTKLRPFCGLKKTTSSLIHTVTKNMYVVMVGFWVWQNFWFKFYLGENVSHSSSNRQRITPLPKYWKNYFLKHWQKLDKPNIISKFRHSVHQQLAKPL